MAQHDSSSAGHEGVGHVVPVKLLAAVLVVLLVLTWLTVAVSNPDYKLGNLSIYIALAIATIKGTLVGMYFMHLRYDRPFHAIVLCTALVFVALFIGLTIVDKHEYEPDVRALREVDPKEYAPGLPEQK